MENDYNIFGKSIRIMKLPLAELGTTTEAAVLEKMVGGISFTAGLLRCLLNISIEMVGGLLDKESGI